MMPSLRRFTVNGAAQNKTHFVLSALQAGISLEALQAHSFQLQPKFESSELMAEWSVVL
jgi:hypothetical protein